MCFLYYLLCCSQPLVHSIPPPPPVVCVGGFKTVTPIMMKHSHCVSLLCLGKYEIAYPIYVVDKMCYYMKKKYVHMAPQFAVDIIKQKTRSKPLAVSVRSLNPQGKSLVVLSPKPKNSCGSHSP